MKSAVRRRNSLAITAVLEYTEIKMGRYGKLPSDKDYYAKEKTI